MDIGKDIAPKRAGRILQRAVEAGGRVPHYEAKKTDFQEETNLRPDTIWQLKKEPEKAKSQQKKKERSELLRKQPYASIPELMVVFNSLPLLEFEMDPFVITPGKIGRKYPERIVPWDSFESRQQGIWEILSASSNYSDRLFAPAAKLQREVENNLGGSYIANVNYTVLRPVLTILRDFFTNKELRQQLQFPSYATQIVFCRDLENLHDSKVSKAEPTRQKAFNDNDVCNLCTVQSEKEIEIPVYRIDYLSPLKLSAAEILYELQGELISTRNLINHKDKDFKYHSKRQVLAVITHLFSSMIKTGVQYGYVRTGEALIFLYISDDPSQVEYHVCNSRDLNLKGPASLHKTAIAKIVAFSIQAVAAKPPPQDWHDAAAELDTWAADYDDVVKNVPKRSQKERIMRDTPDYGTSPSATLVSHLPVALQSEPQTKDTGSNNENKEENPAKCSNLDAPNCGPRSHDLIGIDEVEDFGNVKSDIRPLNNAKNGNGSEKHVHERDYCSVACLLGLADGGDLDPNCPNNADHGQSHLEHFEFLSLLREQLAHDRGRVTDCEPLWVSGTRGVMFKITLTSHGYTVIAKGVELHNATHLTHEDEVYRHLHSIQGIHIPVCLGNIDLLLPYHHWGTEYVRFLLQSYAGVPARDTINELNKFDIWHKATDAMKAIHRLGVIHTHPDNKNIMTKNTRESGLVVQIIDFARAVIVVEEEEVVERTRKRQRLSLESAAEAEDDSLIRCAFAHEICFIKTTLRRVLLRDETIRLKHVRKMAVMWQNWLGGCRNTLE